LKSCTKGVSRTLGRNAWKMNTDAVVSIYYDGEKMARMSDEMEGF